MGFLDDLVSRINWAGQSEHEAAQSIMERELIKERAKKAQGKESNIPFDKQSKMFDEMEKKHMETHDRSLFGNNPGLKKTIKSYMGKSMEIAGLGKMLTNSPEMLESFERFGVDEEGWDRAFAGYTHSLNNTMDEIMDQIAGLNYDTYGALSQSKGGDLSEEETGFLINLVRDHNQEYATVLETQNNAGGVMKGFIDKYGKDFFEMGNPKYGGGDPLNNRMTNEEKQLMLFQLNENGFGQTANQMQGWWANGAQIINEQGSTFMSNINNCIANKGGYKKDAEGKFIMQDQPVTQRTEKKSVKTGQLEDPDAITVDIDIEQNVQSEYITNPDVRSNCFLEIASNPTDNPFFESPFNTAKVAKAYGITKNDLLQPVKLSAGRELLNDYMMYLRKTVDEDRDVRYGESGQSPPLQSINLTGTSLRDGMVIPGDTEKSRPAFMLDEFAEIADLDRLTPFIVEALMSDDWLDRLHLERQGGHNPIGDKKTFASGNPMSLLEFIRRGINESGQDLPQMMSYQDANNKFHPVFSSPEEIIQVLLGGYGSILTDPQNWTSQQGVEELIRARNSAYRGKGRLADSVNIALKLDELELKEKGEGDEYTYLEKEFELHGGGY